MRLSPWQTSYKSKCTQSQLFLRITRGALSCAFCPATRGVVENVNTGELMWIGSAGGLPSAGGQCRGSCGMLRGEHRLP